MFDLGTAIWAPSAKQLYLGMGCCGPAQSYLWHSAQHRIMSPLISVRGYSCTAAPAAGSGVGAVPVPASLKCHLILGFAQFSPGDAVLCLAGCFPPSDKPGF